MDQSPDVDMAAHCDVSFISIHDFSPEARILYSSDSIIDVLGYTPEEVVNKSCWEFFPPEQVPLARHLHQRGVEADRAASLVYCSVKDKSGRWIGCECVFTIVHDVVVVCTSVYKSTLCSQKRALTAPIVRRLFASSPKDPRYRMISYISPKLRQPYNELEHEPRAALFLNRFTRTLTIMYATNGLEHVLGVSAEELRGTSFYYCIAENCLRDAIKCLETAKANDSIAYLRFWFRDPLTDNAVSPSTRRGNEVDAPREDTNLDNTDSSSGTSVSTPVQTRTPSRSEAGSRAQSSPFEADGSAGGGMHQTIFGNARQEESPPATAPSASSTRRSVSEHIELEAVISCASDGLVVCLRQARPRMPASATRPGETKYRNGLFAAPWGSESLLPAPKSRSGSGYPAADRPAHLANVDRGDPLVQADGSESEDVMKAIREQAIFAWALTGINGSVTSHGIGTPLGESVPPHGLPVWTSDGDDEAKMGGETRTDSASSGPVDGKSDYPGPSTKVFGDPGLEKSERKGSGSRKQG